MLIDAKPDAIQMSYGQADLLQSQPGKDKPALVMRIDMGNPYNSERHRVMWSMLQNHDEPIIGALEMDAACVVVNLFMLPDEPELFRQCVENISRVRASCRRYGMPLMIEPLVMLPNEVRGGYQVDGDAEKIVTLVRLASEMGADIIKADPTDDPADFHRVVEAARVPVLVRGGGKEDLKSVLMKSATLMAQGAVGHGVRPQHLPARQSKGGRQRIDGDHPSRAHRARKRGTSTTMAESARFLLGLDVGNTVIKAVLFDLEGRQVSACAIDGQSTTPEPGHVERDLEELWRNASEAIRRCISDSAVDPTQIAATGCAGHGNGLYLLDRDDRPLIGIQSLDTRAAVLAEELATEHGDALPRNLPTGAVAVADTGAPVLDAPSPSGVTGSGRHAADVQGLHHLQADGAQGQ